MQASQKIKYFIIGIISLLVLVFASYIKNFHPKPVLKISKQESSIQLDSQMFSLFSLGQNRAISSVMWITTLLESDISHYKRKDLNSWMYKRFKTISILDNKFYENYLFGGQYLSIIKDDDLGAEDIYSSGLKVYSDDFKLNFHNAYHQYLELGNIEKALESYHKILKNKAALKNIQYLSRLVARLEREKTNSLETSFEILLSAHNDPNTHPDIKKVFAHSLYAIKAEKDLNCLNNKLSNCNYKDFYGNYYIKRNNMYFAKNKWKKFELNKQRQGTTK